MTPEQIGQLLVTVLPSLGIGGLFGVLITAVLKRNSDKDANKISEKDANTRAVGGVIEALTIGLEELRTEINENKTRHDGEITALSTKLAKAERTINEQGVTIRMLVEERTEMIEHMESLEANFPNPPGAPIRPEWLKNIS